MSVKVASIQAPFDTRIKTLAMPMQSVKKQIQRGYMIQQNAMPGYSGNRAGKFVFNFLYNPSTVEATYYVQTSGGAVSYLYPNANDSADLAVPINQSASWTIMFDRTYELNSGAFNSEGQIVSGSAATPAPGNITADPRVYGVLADVVQLQFFTGMMLTGNTVTNQSATGIIDVTGGQYQASFRANQGFMMMIPCWVFFGGQNNINYFGYISEWDVTFTHFTQYMVPMRCVIDISFTMLPPPAPAAGSNTGSSASGFYPTPSGKAPPTPFINP